MRRGLTTTLIFVALMGAAPASRGQPPPVMPLPAPTQARSPVYEMDTLSTGALPPGVLKQMEPLHTLDAIEALLKENYIPFAWAHRQLNTATMPPEIFKRLDALPPREVFVTKQGDGALIAVILSKH